MAYHGGQSNNKLLRGAKGYIYEGGLRVPMFVNWPGKVKARRSSAAVSCLDIFPTLMKVGGVDDFSGVLDGNSVTEIFKKDTQLFIDRPLFLHVASQYKHGACSVIRKGKYKLIQFLATGKVELYNLSLDQSESKDVSEIEVSKTEELLHELVAWRKTNDIPLPPNAAMKF